jgi:hypothetical protein
MGSSRLLAASTIARNVTLLASGVETLEHCSGISGFGRSPKPTLLTAKRANLRTLLDVAVRL